MRTLMYSLIASLTLGLGAHAYADGAIAHVEQRGDGPVEMILIPGSPCDWRVWDEFMTRNSDNYSMRAFTLAGFSGTAPLPTPAANDVSKTPWLDAAVADIAAYIKEHELDDVVVVGHSLGGHLALRLGLEHPDVVSRIVDIDGVPESNLFGDDISHEERIQRIELELEPALRGFDSQRAVAMQEQAARAMVTSEERGEELAEMYVSTDTPIAMEYLIQGLKSNIAHELQTIGVPTLVIVAVGQAGADENARSQIRAQWAAWAGDADAITIRNFEASRHFVMDDQPEELDETIAAFLSGEMDSDTEEPSEPRQ